MKKLLSVCCCILYLDCISRANPDLHMISRTASGEKVLVKAIATVVGREQNKKAPVRLIQLPPDSCPF